MPFASLINSKLPDMTKSLQKVAAHYLANLNNAAFQNLDETARSIDVSTTTVIRFARTLGFDGFTSMQRAVQEEVKGKIGLPERLDQMQESASAIKDTMLLDSMQRDISNISRTMYAISQDALRELIRKINEAENIYVIGMRSSFALAHYLVSRLGQIRPDVRLLEGSGMLYPEALTGCNEKDLCIAFAFPRYSTMTLNLLRWIRKKKVFIALVTSNVSNDLTEKADLAFPCFLDSISFKDSYAAPVALINYIVAAAAVTGHDKAVATIRDTEEFLKLGNYLE